MVWKSEEVSSGLSDACNVDHWVTHEQRCCIQRRRCLTAHLLLFLCWSLKFNLGLFMTCHRSDNIVASCVLKQRLLFEYIFP